MVEGLAPPADWDSLMYHIHVPEEWLAAGRIHLPPDNLHTAFVGLLHLAYLPLLVLGGISAPGLYSALLTALLGPVLLQVGRRHLEGATGALAAAAVWGASGLLMVGGTPRVDGVLTLLLLLAAGAALDAWASDEPRGPLLRVALLAGAAAAAKYNGLILGGLLVLAALPRLRAVRRGRRAGSLLAGTGVFLVLLGPLLLKNQILLGAPFYPFGAERVLPPWIAQAAPPGAEHPSAEGMYGVLRSARAPVTLPDLLFRPGRLSPEPDVPFFRWPLLAALAPLGLLAAGSRRGWALLLLPALGYVTALMGWSPRTNIRYLLPALPLLVLCGALATVAMARWAGRGRRRVADWLIAGVLLASLAPALRMAALHISRDATPRHAVGLISPLEYLVAAHPTHAVMVRSLNDLVPPGSRALLLFEARGLYFQSRVLQDNSLVNWPLLLETGLTERCLEGTAISHVWVGTGPIRFYTARGADLTRLRWDEFEAFAERCLEVAVRSPTFMIYRVRNAPEGRAAGEAAG